MKKSKAAAAARQPSHAAQNGGHALPSKLARYLDPEASWDKDQLPDAVHWIRQAVGLACSLLWGAVPLVGAFWIALFVTISTVIVHLYYAYLLKIDEEDFGGHSALLQEGLFALVALFLLSWTLAGAGPGFGEKSSRCGDRTAVRRRDKKQRKPDHQKMRKSRA